MMHFCNFSLVPLCGTETLKRSHVIENVIRFICNRWKTNPLQSWGIVHLFNVGADLDCASADDEAARGNGREAYGHDVLTHAYWGRRFQIRQSHQTRQALMTAYHNLVAFATQARLVRLVPMRFTSEMNCSGVHFMADRDHLSQTDHSVVFSVCIGGLDQRSH